jgi:hypothetical protein
MPASAVIKTKNHKIVWVNEGYVAIAGARKDLIGKSIGELWASAPSAVKIEKVDETIFKLKHAIVSVETVNDLWGKKLERLRFRFPIRGPSGEVEYMGAIGFDIDQVVGQVEAELKAALVRLDEKTKGKR